MVTQCHEQRWCGALGEGTDGARYLEAWALGESAVLPRGVAEWCVRQVCEGAGEEASLSSLLSYDNIFRGKDRRRAEWFCESFSRTFLRASEDYADCVEAEGMTTTGSRSQFLPSVRRALVFNFETMARLDV